MPCQSANNANKYKTSASLATNTSDLNRPKTAFFHKNAAEHAKHIKLLKEHCKRMGKKKVDRLQTPEEIRYNDYLQITGVSSVCPPAIPSVNLKVYPTLLPQTEIDRIKQASKHLNLEERLEANNKLKEEAIRAKNESNNRKNLLRKIDDERRKAKMEREKDRDGKKELDFDEAEKLKILDRAFVFKQEQEEEVKKANRIILNAKCNVVREAQMQEKIEIGKELRREEIKLENQMLEIDKKAVEMDEQKADKFKLTRQNYADEIKKQLELKESIRFLEIQRMEEEAKIQSLVFGKLIRDEDTEKKLKKEKRDTLRRDLDRVRETFTMFKKLQFEQEKNDEMKVRQYLKERADRDRKIELERQIAKEAVDRKRQELFDIQQKLLSTKNNQEEVALRRDQENKEREYRQKEMEKIMKKREIEKEFAKCRERQILEKKRRQALAMLRNEEDFNHAVEKLKEQEAEIKKMEGKRNKMKEQYREEIIQQMNQKEYERREKAQRAKNEFLAWKEKQDERDKNIKIVINSKLKALKQSDLPEKYIKDVEKQLHDSFKSKLI